MRARGSVVIFLLVVLALVGAAAWWVTHGEPGLVIPANGHTPARPALNAEPTEGSAPLTIAFSVTRDIGTVQTVSFGDGTSAEVADFICGPALCVRYHTYREPGTYSASYEDASGEPIQTFTIIIARP